MFTVFSICAFICSGCEIKSSKLSTQKTSSKISQSEESFQDEVPLIKDATVNFCIENSGSMFGYVNTSGNFRSVIIKLAQHLDFNCKTINYKMRNGKETPIKTTLGELGNFLTFAGMNKGDVTTSDINLMLNESLDKAKEGQVALLISDGIYSIPGNKNDLLANLESLSAQTQNNIARALQEADLITYMIKFDGQFRGEYYPACGGKEFIDQTRPFYVWVIGHKEQLQELFPDSYFESLSGFERIVKFIKLENKQPNCGFVLFQPTGKSKYLTDLELKDVYPRHGEFSFSLAFDFSDHLLPLEYFDNMAVFENDLQYEVVSVVRYDTLTQSQKASAQSNIKISGATHVVTFRKKGNPWGTMNVSIVNVKPSWIDSSSNTDDCNGIDSTSTFGLSYLTKGITDGYEMVNKTVHLGIYEISIKR
jgi:hypothetical protein